MLKLKLQYFGHLMGRTDSFEKTLMLERLRAGGEGDDTEWDVWMVSPTQWTWVWVNSRSWWWTGRPDMVLFMGCKESDTIQWLNWTEDNQLTGGNVMQGEMWKLNRFLLIKKSVIFLLLSSERIIGIRIILIRRIIKILRVTMDNSAIWHQTPLCIGFPDGAKEQTW